MSNDDCSPDCLCCSGEYCETHGNMSCKCDCIDRHQADNGLPFAPSKIVDGDDLIKQALALIKKGNDCPVCGGRGYTVHQIQSKITGELSPLTKNPCDNCLGSGCVPMSRETRALALFMEGLSKKLGSPLI